MKIVKNQSKANMKKDTDDKKERVLSTLTWKSSYQ